MEAIKNLCAISIIKGYEEYMEFNLRKYQTTHCGESSSSATNNSAKVISTVEASAVPTSAGDVEDNLSVE